MICYSLGLGPIPVVYSAECFRPNARSTAMAISMVTTWITNLFITFTFPFLVQVIGQYVFLIFSGALFAIFFLLFYKVIFFSSNIARTKINFLFIFF